MMYKKGTTKENGESDKTLKKVKMVIHFDVRRS